MAHARDVCCGDSEEQEKLQPPAQCHAHRGARPDERPPLHLASSEVSAPGAGPAALPVAPALPLTCCALQTPPRYDAQHPPAAARAPRRLPRSPSPRRRSRARAKERISTTKKEVHLSHRGELQSPICRPDSSTSQQALCTGCVPLAAARARLRASRAVRRACALAHASPHPIAAPYLRTGRRPPRPPVPRAPCSNRPAPASLLTAPSSPPQASRAARRHSAARAHPSCPCSARAAALLSGSAPPRL